MNPTQYTPEQEADIKDREEKALETLKALDLSPAAVMTKVNLGGDVFADRVIPFLRDIKYSPTPNEPTPTPEQPVEAEQVQNN